MRKRITSTGKNTTPSKKITCYQSVTGRGISKKEERRTVNILLMSFDRELTRKAAPLENHSS